MFAMRQILLGPRGAPTPQLPYDAEVEYIQRDFNVDWDGSGGGFNILGYFAGKIPDWSTEYEAVVSAESQAESGFGVAMMSRSGIIGFQGPCVSGQRGTYVFRNDSATIDSGVQISLGSWVAMKTVWSGGNGTHYVNGVAVGTSATTYTSSPSYVKLLHIGLSGNLVPIILRMKSFKINGVADLVPVVLGNECGFYNKIDGELFLTDNAGVTAGPRI